MKKKKLIIFGIILLAMLTACKAGDMAAENLGQELLSLKTEDYRERTIVDFNADFEKHISLFNGDEQQNLDAEFMKTLTYSSCEINAPEEGKPISSYYIGAGIKPEIKDDRRLPLYKSSMQLNGLELEYEVTWDVLSQSSMTIGERDDRINTCIDKMQEVLAGQFSDKDTFSREIERLYDLVGGACRALDTPSMKARIEFDLTISEKLRQ